MRYAPINNSLFSDNRQRFAAQLYPHSIAVFNANDVMPKSADGTRRFVQHTDIFYLSGIDQEETILLICPDAHDEKHREILFIRRTSDEIALWEGKKLLQDEATQLSGIQTVYWLDQFNTIFHDLAIESKHIYLNANEHPRANTEVQTRDARFIQHCKNCFPLHRYERSAPIMHLLRAVKSDIEIDLIRQACAITEKAFRRVLNFIRPGVYEFEIEAEMLHEFLINRSRAPAYESIVASGANACVLHYVTNNCQCRAGDLVLMDFGAEYAGYASDLTRTAPVSGRFTTRQRAIYNAVLRVQRGAIDMLRPGNDLKTYHKAVGRLMETELIALGLLDADAVKQQNPDKPLYKKYFMHGASHHMGLDTHDYGDRYRRLEPGMVLSCEPGIYIPDEQIGIRIENDILITRHAPVDLMAAIPVEVDEIEALMNQKL